MTASQVLSGDSRVMQTISRYLEALRSSVDGDELHSLIARTLRRHKRNGPLGPEYLLDLYGRLDAFARDALSLPSMRIRARLLQQHIAPYIADMRLDISPETASAAPHVEEIILTDVPRTSAEHEPTIVLEGVIERPSEIAQNAADDHARKYQELRRSEQDAWHAIYGTVKDYQRLKEAWMKSLDELANQRDTLETQLQQTTEQLARIETERNNLRAALDTARREPVKRLRTQATPKLLSRTGGRAGQLPKRDVFLRLLEAEIKRIKRSSAPLSLGLIGIENLDVLGDRHGPNAAPAALRRYAEEVLSNFRGYDVVGVYDHDQFIVMFPDTPKEGARRALEKTYKRAIETHFIIDGESAPLPPFAGTVITYSPGEDLTKFLNRANELFHTARAKGRGVLSL